MSYRPHCVGWRKYLNCSYVITRCRQTGIHLLFFYTPDFVIWGLGVKGQSNIWMSVSIHCKYHTGWTAKAGILKIGGTYTPFCMMMASLFFKVRVQRSRSHVNNWCSCYKRYSMKSLAKTAKLDTHSYLKSGK